MLKDNKAYTFDHLHLTNHILLYFSYLQALSCSQLLSTLTYRGRNVSGGDLLALLDGELRPQLEVEVGELDVVGVVETGVVDQAVDGVEGHAGAAVLLAQLGQLQLHPVGLQDANHPL